MPETLPIVLILLTSAVLAVALFRALRLPAMLAYFLVGLALGPHTFGILPDSETNRELAQFGVVFLMFSIGLEFSLPQLYAMRHIVLGLGGMQVAITMIIVMTVCLLVGMQWQAAFVIGAALAMSSTAIVSKMLAERLELKSRHGRLAIGVLLFQDIAVVPMLVLIPALGTDTGNLVNILAISMLKATVMLFILFAFGKSVVTPWFSLVARQRSRELFVMNVLMVTLMLAFATKAAGLSYALGAFIAGMLISETRYRYQVESDIAPFRDILLGLFFVTVGMLLNLEELASHVLLVLGLVLVLVLIKGTLVALLSRAFKVEAGVAIRAGMTLAQAGEFSFVILALGSERGLLSGQALQVVLVASLLSMVLAPFFIQRSESVAARFAGSYGHNRRKQLRGIEEVSKQLTDHVIICGYGRSGQYLGRFLNEEHVPFIALDIDPSRVQEAAAAGEHVMYGDAGRRVVLEAAGGARAKALIISYHDVPSAMKILHVVQENYPQLPVIVRTTDDTHMEALREAGATEVVPEALEGSLMLASHALMLLGVPPTRVVKRIRLFREERYKLFRGFFHGITDAQPREASDKLQPRMHSMVLSASAYAIGKRVMDIGLQSYRVEVKSIRRQNHKGIEPTSDELLAEGDVLVLLGTPEDLLGAEKVLLTGR